MHDPIVPQQTFQDLANDFGRDLYVDTYGTVHLRGSSAMRMNNLFESNNSRDRTQGNCPQDPSKVPEPKG